MGAAVVAGCSGLLDLVFVLDSAGTVHAERWHYMLDFVEWIVDRLDVAADRTRVAVVYWSDSAYVGFTLDRYFVRQVRSGTSLTIQSAKNETHVILNILYSCKSIVMTFSM